MEVLDEKIAMFLAIGCGYGDGYRYGYSSGEGEGICFDIGFSEGDGMGSGDGWGGGGDCGDGYGCGDGLGEGEGRGCDYGHGIKEFNGKRVYDVDGRQTLIYSVHENYAHGAILVRDLTLKPCYIAKVNDCFAHGETLQEAREAALEKSFQEISEEQRIDAFLAAHPDKDRKYSYDDLFRWHNILTGSCEMGRREFCKERGITEKDSFTIKEFCEITKDAYGGNIIKQLESTL